MEDFFCFTKKALSTIEGIGLFTTMDIKKGQKICDYYGVEMSYKKFKQKYGAWSLNSQNTYRMKRIHKILVAKDEPYLSSNPVNFVNESINPNCILKKRALYANRDIEMNEELTLQYPRQYNRFWLS
jgi:SET domain-containing protein